MKSPSAGPSVTVVIPTRNRAPVVGRAVASVLRQTFTDLEVVVVDDASEDDTEAVVRGFDDPRVHYLRLEAPAGCSAARNVGMARAAGAHLAFLDSDDEWLPEKLARQLPALAADAGAGIAVCGITTGDGVEFAPEGSGDVYRRVLEHRFPARCSTFLLSPAAGRSGIRFDERLPAYTDWDFLLRITREFRLVNLPDRLVVKHAEAGPRMWAGANIVEGGMLVLEKYRDELAASPEGRAAIHVKIAAASASMGDTRRARRHLLRAVRSHPRNSLRYTRLAARTLSAPDAPMVPRPLVSVVIPTHDRAHLVGRAVRSVLDQTVRDLEVVVVDDASSDDTEAVITGIGDPRVRYIRLKERMGSSMARNHGMDRATGKHVAFLDSDDEWLPEKLEKQLGVLKESANEVGVVVCGITTTGGGDVIPRGSGDVHRRVLDHRFPARCSTFLLAPAAVQEGLRFDGTSLAFDDWDFLLRATRRYRLANVPEALVVKHQQAERVWSSRNIVAGGQRLLEKYDHELAGSPRGRAELHEKIARAAFALGDLPSARRHLLLAAWTWPRGMPSYARLAARTIGLIRDRRGR